MDNQAQQLPSSSPDLLPPNFSPLPPPFYKSRIGKLILCAIFISIASISGSVYVAGEIKKKSQTDIPFAISIQPTPTPLASIEATDSATATQVQQQIPTATPTIKITSPLLPTPTPLPKTSSPSYTNTTNKLLFGLGPEADHALTARIVKEAPVRMLTSWYNGPGDLAWMTNWRNSLVPNAYADGYTLHLVTFTDIPEENITTPYGPACGRSYPVSDRVVDDMRQLAQTFAGSGTLYVTLFTEFQTYPCKDNEWIGNENYYRTLKDRYLAIQDVFHQHAPNAKVGISWGGWQSRWDDPAKGAGRSLFAYFDDILKVSDIMTFQAMESGTNVDDILNMSSILKAYGKPIVLSHYKPDHGPQATFEADINAIFTDSYIQQMSENGIVAMSFMDQVNMNENEPIYNVVKSGITKYAR